MSVQGVSEGSPMVFPVRILVLDEVLKGGQGSPIILFFSYLYTHSTAQVIPMNIFNICRSVCVLSSCIFSATPRNVVNL